MTNYQCQAFYEVPGDFAKASVPGKAVEEGRGNVISVCGFYVIPPCGYDHSLRRVRLDKLQLDVWIFYVPYRMIVPDHTSVGSLDHGGNVFLHHHLHILVPVHAGIEIVIGGRDPKKPSDVWTSSLALHVMSSDPSRSRWQEGQ